MQQGRPWRTAMRCSVFFSLSRVFEENTDFMLRRTSLRSRPAAVLLPSPSPSIATKSMISCDCTAMCGTMSCSAEASNAQHDPAYNFCRPLTA